MKTIFISCFHPYTSRNILSTDAFDELVKQHDLRIVLFVNAHKKEYIAKIFGRQNVVVEGIDSHAPSRRRSVLIMKRLAKYCLDSDSVRIQRYMKWRFEKKYAYLLMALCAKMVSASPLARRLMRWLDYQVAEKDKYRAYVEKYRPDRVVITDILNERDVEFAQNAHYFGVPVIGMVRSWDNLTLHGLMRIVPEKLLVASEEVKRQAEVLNDCPPETVEIVGVAHYDKYLRGPTMSREQFKKEMGVTEPQKIVLCAPIGDFYITDNTTDPFVLSLLASLDARVIVRFSPTVPVRHLENATPYPNMVFDRPGVNFRGRDIGDQELSFEDDNRLLNELAYSDVVVCGPSTVALDAVFLDRPVIIVNFHPDRRTYYTGIARRYDYDHFKFAIRCGAFRVANSKEELLTLIDEYAKDPARDSEGRERLRRAHCGPRDGKSGLRIARAVINFFSPKNHG